MRSSGELSGSPQAGQVLVSDSIRESLAHSSHMGHAHIGIIIASCKIIDSVFVTKMNVTLYTAI